jgi:hypothetical protein
VSISLSFKPLSHYDSIFERSQSQFLEKKQIVTVAVNNQLVADSEFPEPLCYFVGLTADLEVRERMIAKFYEATRNGFILVQDWVD